MKTTDLILDMKKLQIFHLGINIFMILQVL